jgi:hypothetical protein
MSSRGKEQAAQRAAARAAAEQQRRRRQQQTRLAAITAVLAVLGAILAVVVLRDEPQPASASGGLLATAPPWPAQSVGLAERVADLGFPPPGDESYHAHVLLSVFRNGEQVQVPANLGFDARGGHASLHTHTPDGVVHMEADDPYPYELEHVFRMWGVAFGDDRLGGDVAGGENNVFVYVNGKPAPPGPVVLADGDNVVVAYGKPGSFPTLPDDSARENA